MPPTFGHGMPELGPPKVRALWVRSRSCEDGLLLVLVVCRARGCGARFINQCSPKAD